MYYYSLLSFCKVNNKKIINLRDEISNLWLQSLQIVSKDSRIDIFFQKGPTNKCINKKRPMNFYFIGLSVTYRYFYKVTPFLKMAISR